MTKIKKFYVSNVDGSRDLYVEQVYDHYELWWHGGQYMAQGGIFATVQDACEAIFETYEKNNVTEVL